MGGKSQQTIRLKNFLRQKPERDRAVQPRVFGLIYHTHPDSACLLDDAVVRDSLADHK